MKKIILTLIALLILTSFVSADKPCSDIQSVSHNSLTIVRAHVYNASTNEVITKVETNVYCEHNSAVILIGSALTNTKGFITVSLKNNIAAVCNVGDEVWIKIPEFDYVSDREIVQRNLRPKNHVYINANVSTPEFNMATMSIAILGACLGLLMIRRKE